MKCTVVPCSDEPPTSCKDGGWSWLLLGSPMHVDPHPHDPRLMVHHSQQPRSVSVATADGQESAQHHHSACPTPRVMHPPHDTQHADDACGEAGTCVLRLPSACCGAVASRRAIELAGLNLGFATLDWRRILTVLLGASLSHTDACCQHDPGFHPLSYCLPVVGTVG